MLLFKLADRGLGLINTIVLARILTPADFGLVAMAAVVMEFLQILTAFSFDMALIGNQEPDDRSQYDSAWTLNVLLGAVLMVSLLLLARPMAAFFGDPRLVTLMTVLSVRPLLIGFENIGVVKFRKELSFDREFRFLLSKRIALFVVTIALALILRTYWALVCGIVLGGLLGVVISYLAHPYRPRFCLTRARDMIGFSKWLLFNNLISFGAVRSASFVIGRQLGAVPLGVFEIANEIARIPTTEVIAPINRVIFPAYAAVAGDRVALRKAFVKSMAVIALFALPAAAGLFAIADVLVNAILGAKWIEVAPLIRVLALYGALNALYSNTYYIHITLGDIRVFTLLTAISAVALPASLAIFTPLVGLGDAALAFPIVAAVLFPMFYWELMRKLSLKLAELVAVFWRPLVAAGVMCVSLHYVKRYLHTGSSLQDVADLLMLVGAGVFLYGACLWALWLLTGRPEGAESFLKSNLDTFAQRLRDKGFRRGAA